MPVIDSFRVAHHPFLTDSNLSRIDGNELWTDPRASPTGMSTDHAGTLIQFASVGAFLTDDDRYDLIGTAQVNSGQCRQGNYDAGS